MGSYIEYLSKLEKIPNTIKSVNEKLIIEIDFLILLHWLMTLFVLDSLKEKYFYWVRDILNFIIW